MLLIAILKVSPQLLGLNTFTLDRMVAILGSLLAEHDDRPLTHPDVEVQRMSMHTAVSGKVFWQTILLTIARLTNF